MVSFRFPEDAIAYYTSEAKATQMRQVDIVLEAIYLDRDLGRRLADVRPQLERAATAMGLNLDHDLAEVLANLVQKAVAQAEPTHTPPVQQKTSKR